MKTTIRSFCLLGLALAAAASCKRKFSTESADPSPKYPTYRVEGRNLVDPYGETVVLRGVNAMIIYWDKYGTVTYPEIAKTGANAVRIFWQDDPVASAADLDLTLGNCIRNKMIAVPGVWMATGEWNKLADCVDFWCRADVAAAVKKHEKAVLVNIANEAGDGSVTDAAYRAGYSDAVARIRAAGIRTPLVIDAAGWGRAEKTILNNARALLDGDPEHNLVFSWHPWDPKTWGGTKTRITAALDSAVARNIPFIMGEFSQSEQGDDRWSSTPVEWRHIMESCQARGIGWLAWVWWCCGDTPDHHSLTLDKMYGHWNNAPWGEECAVSGPYSIKNTSVRPASMQ
jgi:hypothetical protein